MGPGEDDRDAVAEFDDLYLHTTGRIVGQMLLLTGDIAEAEDVTQEAFERAWLRWSIVRNCESPEAWVRTVARRLAVSRWRRTRNQTAAWLRREPPPTPPELDVSHVALIAALQALPPAQRVAIVLHHLADLSVAQVAAETETSVGAVKQHLFRGRKALAEQMADNNPPGRAEQEPHAGRERK